MRCEVKGYIIPKEHPLGLSRAGVELYTGRYGMVRTCSPLRPARMFHPYQTMQPLGTDLGLNIARDILREHGSELEVASMPGARWRHRRRAPAAKAEDIA